MESYTLKIIESLVIVVLFIIVRATSNRVINRTMIKRLMQKPRADIIKKGVNLSFLILSCSMILTIWGVKQADVAVYIGSILTVVGVAFFAQWSILSNITSSIIIFFNHSIKLEDTIIIMEAKDYEIEGKVSTVGLFFVTMRTEDGHEITLPNNIFIQKMIRKKEENSE